MTAYLVKLDPASSNSVVLEQNFNGVVVEAATVAEAKEMAESTYRVDAADWANAIATVVTVAADFTGWSARLRVSPPTGAPIFDETVDGSADGVVGLAINAAGNVASVAMYPPSQDATYPDALQLIANCLLHVAGAY